MPQCRLMTKSLAARLAIPGGGAVIETSWPRTPSIPYFVQDTNGGFHFWTVEDQRKSLHFQFQWNQDTRLVLFARQPRVLRESMPSRAALRGRRQSRLFAAFVSRRPSL